MKDVFSDAASALSEPQGQDSWKHKGATKLLSQGQHVNTDWEAFVLL